MTNREDTVPSQVVDVDKGASDGNTICRKTHIERRVCVKRADCKRRERRIAAGGLNRGADGSQPGSKGGDNRESREYEHVKTSRDWTGELSLGVKGAKKRAPVARAYIPLAVLIIM